MASHDLIPRAQIQQYLLKRTGTLVTKTRIGNWIGRGELRLVQIPRRCEWCKPGLYVTRQSLKDLIVRYSTDTVQ